MKARTVILAAAVVALGLIMVAGVALARGAVGAPGWMNRGAFSNVQGTPSATCPMTGAYRGPGGMMGGYPSAQGAQGAQATPATGVTQVSIQNFAFQPATIQVARGTTVTWTNDDSAPHTVTFRNGGMSGSGTLQRGQNFSYTFDTAGTYTYYCGVHPSMIGTVIVMP